MKKMDDSKIGTPFVVTGLLTMVEDEGFTARESLEILDDIKNQVFFALLDIQKEAKTCNEAKQ